MMKSCVHEEGTIMMHTRSQTNYTMVIVAPETKLLLSKDVVVLVVIKER